MFLRVQGRGSTGSAAMLAINRSAGAAPDVNLKNPLLHKADIALKWGFETQGRCHQNTKTGASVAPQKGLMSSKLKKKEHLYVDLQRAT